MVRRGHGHWRPPASAIVDTESAHSLSLRVGTRARRAATGTRWQDRVEPGYPVERVLIFPLLCGRLLLVASRLRCRSRRPPSFWPPSPPPRARGRRKSVVERTQRGRQTRGDAGTREERASEDHGATGTTRQLDDLQQRDDGTSWLALRKTLATARRQLPSTHHPRSRSSSALQLQPRRLDCLVTCGSCTSSRDVALSDQFID
jgi:hypothetical protein